MLACIHYSQEGNTNAGPKKWIAQVAFAQKGGQNHRKLERNMACSEWVGSYAEE